MIQLPSPPAVAVVQHAPPPLRAPLGIAAFVTPIHVDGALADWQLTDDVVAFGPTTAVDDFAAWRNTWERSFVLDPVASICRLAETAAELTGRASAAPLTELVEWGFETVVTPAGLAPLTASLAIAADAIRLRGASGLGVVDVTPDSARVGLAAAWSPGRISEPLAGDEHLGVWLTPEGLRVVPADGAAADRVTEVAMSADAVRVTHAGGVLDLPAARARPLAWLVPGATAWRVRAVPEVVVWARTLAGVDHAARYAIALGLPVRFTTRL